VVANNLWRHCFLCAWFTVKKDFDMEKKQKTWLEWAREIEAIAQTGMHYTQDEFDRQRYQRLMQISAEMISAKAEVPVNFLMDIFTTQVGYATPKVDVRAAIFKEDRLLMVKERTDEGWTMPGGWADVGDVPSQAAEREAWEEAGLQVKARKLIGVYDANRKGPLELFHAYKIVYLCELVGGEPTTSHETIEVAFFSMKDMPAKLSGERTLPRHIQDAFAARSNPQIATVFD
jgi:ADP-ribose pyrophosphatase YjhB (NUDIX family)